MYDLIIRNANLPDGRQGIDIGILNGKIGCLQPEITDPAKDIIEANGQLVTPPFIDSHFHLDSTLSLGQPRLNQSGTLLEGIQIWNELKPDLTAEHLKNRARTLCHWAIANGCLAIRSHVDICDDRLLAVQALIELREELRPWIDIQLVAFPQDGYLRYPNAISNLNRALSMGVDVVGGIPHFERSADQGTQSIKMLCEIAAVKGLMVDMHCDETDDPLSRHVESLAFETQRLGLHGYVTGSHLTSMHSMDNYYVSKLMPLMREAQLHVVANPLINITLQGRHDLYPKRRGMTRVKELLALGINVAMGHDCVMDPWYSLGSHDMLEVAHMGLHIAQMTGVSEMRQIFETVTQNAARVLRLENYGLDVGCNADLVVLQALDPIDALRRKATRLYVVRRGQIIARAEPMSSRLSLAGRELEIDWSNPTP
jgi:cytosine deaminase